MLFRSCQNSEKPVLLTRDAIDLVAEHMGEEMLLSRQLCLMASMPQLIKIFRAVYYPKVLTLSQPLVQVAEILHKFGLSYPVGVVTVVGEQILVARAGKIVAMDLAKTLYTPLSIWRGEAAGMIAAYNMYNPNNFSDASVSAIFAKP